MGFTRCLALKQTEMDAFKNISNGEMVGLSNGLELQMREINLKDD